jgi:hypothetical protein
MIHISQLHDVAGQQLGDRRHDARRHSLLRMIRRIPHADS